MSKTVTYQCDGCGKEIPDGMWDVGPTTVGWRIAPMVKLPDDPDDFHARFDRILVRDRAGDLTVSVRAHYCSAECLQQNVAAAIGAEITAIQERRSA